MVPFSRALSMGEIASCGRRAFGRLPAADRGIRIPRPRVQHSINGHSRSGTRAEMDGLIEAMNRAGKLTIGIGDGGNEIGFGAIVDANSGTGRAAYAVDGVPGEASAGLVALLQALAAVTLTPTHRPF